MEIETSMVSLKRVLEYDNPQVLNKFRTLFSLSRSETEEIFTELKKWLWLCAQRKYAMQKRQDKDPSVPVIHVGMIIIDELWHTFILHTKDYADFCEQHFGFAIHHSPGNPDFQTLSEGQTREQLNCIWELLGSETLIKWYEEFAERYSPEALLKLMKPPVFGRPCEAT